MKSKSALPRRTLVAGILVALAVSACESGPSAGPTPTSTATPTASATPSASPSATPTATAIATAKPSASPTPGGDAALDCFNPQLYRDGTRLETTVRWTVSGEPQRVLEYDTIVRDVEQTHPEGATTKSATELRMYPSTQPTQAQDQAFDTSTRQMASGRVMYVHGYYDSRPFADAPPGTGPGSNYYESYFFYENDPAHAFRYDVSAGDNYQQEFEAGTSQGEPLFRPTTVQLSTTFIGHEAIDVPAGRFDTCKFTELIRENAGEIQTTTWLAVGSGVTVRRERKRGDSEELFELVSAAVNSKPVLPQ